MTQANDPATEYVNACDLVEALNLLVEGKPIENPKALAQLDETGWTKQGVLIPLPTHILGQPLKWNDDEYSPIWTTYVPPFDVRVCFSVWDDVDIRLNIELYGLTFSTEPFRVVLCPEDDLSEAIQRQINSVSFGLRKIQDALDRTAPPAPMHPSLAPRYND